MIWLGYHDMRWNFSQRLLLRDYKELPTHTGHPLKLAQKQKKANTLKKQTYNNANMQTESNCFEGLTLQENDHTF